MKRIWRDNSLTIVMLGLFLLLLCGQAATGFFDYNSDQQEHQKQAIGFVEYLGSGHFIEGIFENWESEFLQMGAYVLLTAFLFQKGSAESKDPDGEEPVDQEPETQKDKAGAPGPVRRGGAQLKIYKHSLSLALFALFAFSFALHAVGGAREYSQEQKEHGGQEVSTLQYLGTSRFWYESLQNWQSEFLAVAALAVLSIWLREEGSPESKAVADSHEKTGSS